MIPAAWFVLLLGYLPGALVFRLPVGNRDRRAALPAEERVFWGVVLSVVVSIGVTLMLAAVARYRFERLVWVVGGLCLLLVVLSRGRLRFGAAATRPTWTAVLPVALLVLAGWFAFAVPPAEYVMGGKDPGVYLNAGIQIAQRGSLTITDPTVSGVPGLYRDLFFPSHNSATYYSSRFMGFFLLDPDAGAVVSQFPHGYPASIAIAYGINGLSGARWVLGVWGLLGVAAVYFLGARVAGRPAGFAGAALLAVNLAQIWYSRYPNAEMALQPLIFAALLGVVRAQYDRLRFFAPVAAGLLTLGLFVHLTALFAIGAAAGAIVLARLDGRPLLLSFVVPLAAGTALAASYYANYLPTYFLIPTEFVRFMSPAAFALLGALALVAAWLWRAAGRPSVAVRVRPLIPVILVGVLGLAGAYAYFLRTAVGLLAPHDADSLRTFALFYVSPMGLAAAFVGLVVLSRRSFWVSAPVLLIVAVFALVFFYRIRIIPEHFWAARRFIAVLIPGALLLVGAAAFSDGPGPPGLTRPWVRWARYAAGVVFVVLLGQQYIAAAQPIVRHVEYAGLIPHLEALANRFEADDLVIFESRNASDVHVMALPLAYIYARQVLVLAAADPDKTSFREFLTWAHERYGRVYFVGGGGTELLSRTTAVAAIAGERFQIPEYQSEWNTYPRETRRKEFEFGVYEFLPGAREPGPSDLDVGVADDLYVRRFHAKETLPNGLTYRWTRDVSYVSILGVPGSCRSLTIWMSGAGRPPNAPPAEVEFSLEGRSIGAVTAGRGVEPYTFPIPPDLAAAMAASPDAAQLRITTRTWNPRLLIGAADTRNLGVMLDRMSACTETLEQP